MTGNDVEVLRGDIAKLDTELGELKEQQIRTSANTSIALSKLNKLEATIHGNGQEGLLVRVAKVQQQVKAGVWLATAFGGAVVSGLVALLLR